MTARRTIRMLDRRQPGIVRIREVVIPATGLDALPELVERLERLSRRLGIPPTPPPQPQRRPRQ